MSSLRPYKFLLIAIAQRVSDEGRVVGEEPLGAPQGQHTTLYGLEGLQEYVDQFEDSLAKFNELDEVPA